MAFQILLHLPCCTFLLNLCLLLLCCSPAKSDTIIRSTTNNTTRSNNNQPCTFLFLENSPTTLNLTDRAAFCIPELVSTPGSFFDTSLTISFNLSIYKQVSSSLSKANNSSVVLIAIHPTPDFRSRYTMFSFRQYGPEEVWPRISNLMAASNVSTHFSWQVDGTLLIWLQVDMDDPPEGSSSSSIENTYRVTISNYVTGGFLTVHVGGDGVQEAVNSTTTIPSSARNMTVRRMSMSMGYFLSMRQLLNLDIWNMKIRPNYLDGNNRGSNVPYGYGDDNSQRLKLAVILGSIFGSIAAIAVAATAVYFYFNSKYRRWKNEQERLAKMMQGLPGVPTKVDFTDIKRATKNFHETMKLGKGGFGTVYRCTLPTPTSVSSSSSSLRSSEQQAIEVAVKKFMQEVEDRRYDDFLAEVSIINRLRHKNIVPLVGWSYNKGVPILVYEYMTNDSLDQHLFRGGGGRGSNNNNTHRNHIDDAAAAKIWQWDTRYNIVRDVATGLHYVHHEHEPMVLHRDIKASNIMIDSAFRARLGDFGIACTVAANKSYVTGIAGTFGYISPEYAMSLKATRQTDIYAFGVLILEIVTGKRNADVPPDNVHVTEWIWRLHRQGILLEALDRAMLATGAGDIDEEEAKRLLLLGLACTNPNASSRPSMVEVVQILNKLAPMPDVPLEKPRFMWPPEEWCTHNSVTSSTMVSDDGERSMASTTAIELSQHRASRTSREHMVGGGVSSY